MFRSPPVLQYIAERMSQRYVVLLDTGFPQTFTRRHVLDRMLLVAVDTSYGLEGGTLPPRPGVGFGGLVPRTASAVLGGLVPRTESAVLGGLPFTSADYCDFRTHGPHICLLYTSPSPRDQRGSRMPSSA